MQPRVPSILRKMMLLARCECSAVKLWARGFNTARMKEQWNVSLSDSESRVLKTHDVFN